MAAAITRNNSFVEFIIYLLTLLFSAALDKITLLLMHICLEKLFDSLFIGATSPEQVSHWRLIKEPPRWNFWRFERLFSKKKNTVCMADSVRLTWEKDTVSLASSVQQRIVLGKQMTTVSSLNYNILHESPVGCWDSQVPVHISRWICNLILRVCVGMTQMFWVIQKEVSEHSRVNRWASNACLNEVGEFEFMELYEFSFTKS